MEPSRRFAILWSCCLAGVAGALETPAREATVGLATQPATASREGTVAAPALWSPTGNLVVTGQVAGGKHLRRGIPYTDPRQLQSPLGTTSLDGFYRQAATSWSRPRWEAGVQPYYSPSATAAYTSVGRPLAATASPIRAGGGWTGAIAPLAAPGTFQLSPRPRTESRTLAGLAWPSAAGDHRLRLQDPAVGVGLPRDPNTEISTASNEASAVSDRGVVAPLDLNDVNAVTLRAEWTADALARTQGRSVDDFQASQYEAWIAIGEAYLRKGDPIRAADAFTLAAHYHRDDAQALAGRSAALLVQGRYALSALFLGRALEAMPAYAEYPSVLVTLLGPETTRTCLRGLQSRLALVPATDLLFLAGYLHYQLGDLVLAAQTLHTAAAHRDAQEGLAVLAPVVAARRAGSLR